MDKPNILVFMTDQQRGDTTPPYSRAKTPNLKRFSEEGLSFSNAYTIAPHCCPSRATFFSGLYPSQHGVWNNVDVGNTLSKGLYEGVRLFSEDLKVNGYDMYFSGKWHVSNVESPLDRGFDVMRVPSPEEKSEIRHERPNPYEWERYKNFKQRTERAEGEIIRLGYTPYTHYGEEDNPKNDDTVVDDAIDLILNRGKKDTPWFQFVGTLGPHDPYFVPQEYLDMYDIDDIELPASFYDEYKNKPGLYKRTKDRFDQLTEREHKEAIRHYLAFCTYEDALFGRVLDALEKSGQKDNTLVVYLSDHGDYMAEHGLWCKGLPCFKGAYHIPAALRWPSGIKNPGRVVDEFINLSDFAPTFLDLAGVKIDREFIGKSLVPFINDEKPDEWREEIFTQSNGNELYGIQRSIMTKNWKYVYNGFDYDELYDLQNDPNEIDNIIDNKENDKVVRSLCKKLWEFAHKTGDVCINPYIMVSLAPYGPGVVFEQE